MSALAQYALRLWVSACLPSVMESRCLSSTGSTFCVDIAAIDAETLGVELPASCR